MARRERHPMPTWVLEAIQAADLTAAYDARPAYQRNDYLGWITRAKREQTQQRRLAQMLDELRAGDRYMKMAWRGRRPRVDPSEADLPASPEQAAPRLLSGGNPQIAKGDGAAVVRAYLDAMPGWKQDVGRQLDALVTATVPEVQQAVRWNTPFYGVAGQGWFLGFHCLTGYVKVSWLNGASLDPRPPIAAKAPGVRYSHVREGEVLDEALWARWIAQAALLPGEPLF